jgi:hypothetical protein
MPQQTTPLADATGSHDTAGRCYRLSGRCRPMLPLSLPLHLPMPAAPAYATGASPG